MEKIKTEEVRRRRGRPKLDAHITEEYAPSRRQALNKMYLYEGVHLLSVAATEIQNSEVLWREDRTAVTLKSRDGILEQLGRMAVQDKLGRTDCVYLANLAIAAVRAGYTTREVEVALRKKRKWARSLTQQNWSGTGGGRRKNLRCPSESYCFTVLKRL